MKRVTLLVAMAMFALVGVAQAQEKGAIEIGSDAMFTYSITGKLNDVEQADLISFDLPAANWRFGFWMNENISLEPGIGVSYLKVTDSGPSITTISGQLFALYNMPSGLFFRAGGVIDFANLSPGGGGESSSTTVFGFGGGLGYRTDLVGMLKMRFGGDVVYTLENSDDGVPSAINVVVGIGLSYFTK